MTIAKVAGWWGLWASLLAFYTGAAVLFRDVWSGRNVLPQGFTVSYLEAEQVLLPSVKLHGNDHDVEAGRPHRSV